MQFRDLLLIDDQKIRKEMFSATASILKKMKRLEQDHEAFLNWDQRLYESWYQLTFHRELAEAEKLQRRHQTLCNFQLHLQFLAQKSNLSPEKAYVLLLEEERQYQNGDEEWRFVIEKLRQHRLEFALAAQETKSQKKELGDLPVTGTLFDVAGIPSEPEPAPKVPGTVDLSGLTRKERTTYYYLKEISEETLEKHFANPTLGYALFKDAFHIAMKCEDWLLLARLWQSHFFAYRQRLLKFMPSHLLDFLNQMITEARTQNEDPQEALERELELKTLYRKLVRLLHPDTRPASDSSDLSGEIQKLWLEVQQAYKAKDLKTLKRLELMSLIYLEQLNSLTLDEIYESSLIFTEELEKLKQRVKASRKHPAWRFTSRRSYETLARKTREHLQKKIDPLAAEVTHLESLFQSYGALAGEEALHFSATM